MRILVLTAFLPLAGSRHGGAVYLHTLLGGLARRAEVELLSFATEADAQRSSDAPAGLTRVTLVPPPFAGSRARGPRSAATLADRAFRQRLPLAVAKLQSARFRRALARRLKDGVPDAVLAEMVTMGSYLAPGPRRGPLRVLTDHEGGDSIPARLPLGHFGARIEAANWVRYFKDVYRRADLVQTLTDSDARRLLSSHGVAARVRPMAIPLPTEVVHPELAPPRLLFLGNFRHHPNVEAAHRLAHTIWPRVRASQSQAELWIAGANAQSEITRLEQIEGVRVLGEVDDLFLTMRQCRAMFAALWSGGGTRVKAWTALGYGLPVIGNDLGMTGIDAAPPAVARANDDDGLAALAIALLGDPNHAAHAGRSAREWAATHLGGDRAASIQLDHLRDALEQR
ncbi:MAG: glycosyltransferase [Planctomycetota bacterium]